MAALIKSNGEYFCGGTLVSNRKVVTGEILTKLDSGENSSVEKEKNCKLFVKNWKKAENIGKSVKNGKIVKF